MGSKRGRNSGQKRAAKLQARRRRSESAGVPQFRISPMTQPLLDDFRRWLHENGVIDEAELYVHLVRSALTSLSHARRGFSATDWLPDDAHFLLDAAQDLLADPSDDVKRAAMPTISSAFMFLEFLGQSGLWTGTEQNFTHCTDDFAEFVDPSMSPILPEDISLPEVDADDELRALAALPVIATLTSLVDWIGEGAAVTSTGVPKPATVPGLADAMGIDLAAIVQEPQRTKGVRSMRDVPEMMEYWEVAEKVRLITVGSVRTVRGPGADLISDRTIRALPLLRAAVTEYVRKQLVSEPGLIPEISLQLDIALTQTVLAGMTSEPLSTTGDDAPSGGEGSFAETLILQHLDTSVEQGWLTKTDAYRVPVPLRPAVFAAAQFAVAAHEYTSNDSSDFQVTLRISLEDSHVPVWRSVRVDAGLPLAALHALIQTAFGWENRHLHEFSVGSAHSDGTVFVPSADIDHLDIEGPAVAEEEVLIGAVLGAVDDQLTYVYDFGDNWTHQIVVESVDPFDPQGPMALCLEGCNMAPYEDSGGVSGWEDKLEVSANPNHPDHREIREWLGLRPNQQLDVSSFDRDSINDAFEAVFR